MSHCTYGLLVWGHSAYTHRVFRLQRRAIRVLCNLNYRDDVKQHFIDLKLLTLPSVYIFYCLRYVKENIGNYSYNCDTHSYSTRSATDIKIDFTRIVHNRFSVNYYGPVMFNKLPLTVRNLDIKKFKTVIKNYLVNKAFYSIQEFLQSEIIEM